ncbi:MAG: DNA polymerase III subunit delta [Rhodospirillales bacterium]|nr:DNA polymerase III subunit delta [Rhodospirillales bacterium]
MKISGSRIQSFLRQPGTEISAVLFFGPDQGLVHERAKELAKLYVDDLKDPFRVAELTSGGIKSDPASLGDEAAQVSMSGGQRVIFIPDATDGISEVVAALLNGPGGGAFVILLAGNLAPRSSLRNLFEKSKNGAAIGCYGDDGKGLEGVIIETLGRYGLTVAHDALGFLVTRLGGDRLVSRMELEKLALYVGGNPSKGADTTVTLEDAQASVGDSAQASIDLVTYSTVGGDAHGLDRAFERALLDGTSPIGILRAVQMHLQRLHLALGMVDGGMPPGKAVDNLRPPIIYKFKGQFQAQLQFWRTDRLVQAMGLVTEAEIDCKSTGMPSVAVCHRALLRIAQAAHGNRR